MKEKDLSDNAKEWLEVIREQLGDFNADTLHHSLDSDGCSEQEIAFLIKELQSLS